jgi:hypothetical protein
MKEKKRERGYTMNYYHRDHDNMNQCFTMFKQYTRQEVNYSDLIDFAYGHGVIELLNVLEAYWKVEQQHNNR